MTGVQTCALPIYLKFNRYLLVDLAEALDDIDIAKVREGENSLRLVPFSFHDDCYSYDPIAGVLDAMGNNRFAALAYFAPSTDDGNVDKIGRAHV